MTTTVSFMIPVQDDLLAVEALMRSQANNYHPDLRAAMDLLISAGGKRIRPVLTILTGKMLGAPHQKLISMATAIEMLHTATLVHDDLIDGALLRRGMPTLNSRWAPGATVLTGDFIFACAARLAADTDSVAVMKLFSRTLTTIVDGEITQMLGSRCKADREGYMKRIYAKTASLFETSGQSPAIIAQASDEVQDIMRVFGYEIGLAFQIIDDILDFTGDQATIGKPVGSDLRMGIVTLPALHYVETHPNDPLTQALREGVCLDGEKVEKMIASIRGSDAIRRSHEDAVEHVANGIKALRRLPQTSERYALEELANYIVERKL